MGGFRRGIGNPRAKTKLDVGNMNAKNVATLGVVSKCYTLTYNKRNSSPPIFQLTTI